MTDNRISNSQVREELRKLLLSCTFADSVNSNDKISDITTFSSDIEFIKQNIKDQFGLNIHQDISGWTFNRLSTLLFIFVVNKKQNFIKSQFYVQNVKGN